MSASINPLKITHKISGWGRYPTLDTVELCPAHSQTVQNMVAMRQNNHPNNQDDQSNDFIARGLGRSYGDSALAHTTLQTNHLDYFLNFDALTGQLTCSAGLSFAEILKHFIPKGWFLPVTPGTQFVTVGGAIASDVHGKNHHRDGCFSQHVTQLTLCVASGELVTCSLKNNRPLFLATCGGMGLTGIIVEATFTLTPIETAFVTETTWKTRNLAETMALFEASENATYSVAWIDCLATGDSLGRSLLMLGEHTPLSDWEPANAHQTNPLPLATPSKLSIPMDMPNSLLNRYSIKAFNGLYYYKTRQKKTQRQVHYAPYFYPLDGIRHWNRLYGKQGFTQYQFVLPKTAGLEGMTHILKKIAESKRGSFLAVLKAFGPSNENYLSFPMTGYTLALDFKMDSGLFAFLDTLDQIVLSYGGRLYLAKDARMTELTFKQSYPNWQVFQTARQNAGAIGQFNSLQSRRLGLSI